MNGNLPVEDENLRKAVQEAQAFVGAIKLLLIEQGLFTEQQFQQAYARVDRFMEERRTRNGDRAREELLDSLNHSVRQVVSYIRRNLLVSDSSEVRAIIPQLKADLERDGVFILVTDPAFTDTGGNAIFADNLRYAITNGLAPSELASWLLPVCVIVVSDQDDSLSAKFELLAASAPVKSY